MKADSDPDGIRTKNNMSPHPLCLGGGGGGGHNSIGLKRVKKQHKLITNYEHTMAFNDPLCIFSNPRAITQSARPESRFRNIIHVIKILNTFK